MPNFQMLEQVVGVIEANPERHDQRDWARKAYDESGQTCGTTMCFAGWTVFLNGAKIKFNDDSNYTARCIDKHGEDRDIELYAAELLDLNWTQREQLFYNTDADVDDLKRIIKDWQNES